MKKIKSLIPYFLGLLFLLFTGGRFNNPLLAWFPMVFLMRFYRTGNHIVKYLLTSMGMAIISMIAWYGIQPLPLPAYIISMTVTSLITTLPLLLDRLLYKRVKPFASTLVYPVVATLLEYLFISGNPMGSFGAMAYSQTGNLPLMQFVSVAGLTGITFLMNWFPSFLNGLWESYEKREFHYKKALPFAIILTAIYLFGFINLSINKESETYKVSAIFKTEYAYDLRDITMDVNKGNFDKAYMSYRSYMDLSLKEIEEGQELIAWPEGAVVTEHNDLQTKLNEISTLAKNGNVIIAAPIVILEEGKPFDNSLYLFGNDGEILFKHVKYGGNEFEGSLKGSGLLQKSSYGDSNLSGVICWDMDFPMTMGQLGRMDVDILFAPANDWEAITPLHGEMALFRAIEQGTSLIRPTTAGLTLISDHKGRILNSENWFTSEKNVIRSEISRKGATTIYGYTGDILPLLLFAALMMQLLSFLLLGIRKVLLRRRSADNRYSDRDSQ